jgi:hypothetical protein
MKAKTLAKYLAKVNKARTDLIQTGMPEDLASAEAMGAVVRIMTVPHVNQYLISRKIYGDASPSTFYLKDPTACFLDFMRWFLEQIPYTIESDDENDSGIVSDSSMTFTARTQATTSKPEVKATRTPTTSQTKTQSILKLLTQKPAASKPATAKPATGKPAAPTPRQKVFVCIFCSKNHKSDYCTYDVPTRVSIVDRLALCKCCLKPGHRKEECPSDNTCCHCAKKGQWKQHNTALCDTPQALTARMQGLSIDWVAYRKAKSEDPNYIKYKQAILKKRLEQFPPEFRVQVAQVIAESMASDDEEMPTHLEATTEEETTEEETTEEQPSTTE